MIKIDYSREKMFYCRAVLNREWQLLTAQFHQRATSLRPLFPGHLSENIGSQRYDQYTFVPWNDLELETAHSKLGAVYMSLDLLPCFEIQAYKSCILRHMITLYRTKYTYISDKI